FFPGLLRFPTQDIELSFLTTVELWADFFVLRPVKYPTRFRNYRNSLPEVPGNSLSILITFPVNAYLKSIIERISGDSFYGIDIFKCFGPSGTRCIYGAYQRCKFKAFA